jgi:hypothetical protein
MRFVVVVFAAMSLFVQCGSTADARAQHWYYCRTTHQFYPYTQRCAVPWRVVKPYLATPLNAPRNLLPSAGNLDDTLSAGCEGVGTTTPHDPMCERPAPQPVELRHGGGQTPAETAAGEKAYKDCLGQSFSGGPRPVRGFPFDSAPWMNYRKKWREKCDNEERTAIEQFRTEEQAKRKEQSEGERAAYQRRRAIEKAKSRGYELVPTVKDLILDGKGLADRNAKIQIAGTYKKRGNMGVLYGSSMEAYAEGDNYMPVLTNDAARALRAILMEYPCQSVFGCELEVGGHMTMCKHIDLLEKDYPETPCLNIEVPIVYRWGD